MATYMFDALSTVAATILSLTPSFQDLFPTLAIADVVQSDSEVMILAKDCPTIRCDGSLGYTFELCSQVALLKIIPCRDECASYGLSAWYRVLWVE